MFLIWLGIDEAPKIGLIIAGTVFFNILMTADVVRGVPIDMVNSAYTLGAGRARVLRYGHSGEISGDHGGVVGYMAAAIGDLADRPS